MQATVAQAKQKFGPPAPPGANYTYRFWHPGYGQWQTLDSYALTPQAALRRARTFITAERNRLAAAGFEATIPLPELTDLKAEG